jgi:hypothetical protein
MDSMIPFVQDTFHRLPVGFPARWTSLRVWTWDSLSAEKRDMMDEVLYQKSIKGKIKMTM